MAFAELEQLVRHLGEELSSFRRRALQAESRVRTLEAERDAPAPPSSAAHDSPDREPVDPRVVELEAENTALRQRLEAATERTRHVLDRVRFLRQQQAHGGER